MTAGGMRPRTAIEADLDSGRIRVVSSRLVSQGTRHTLSARRMPATMIANTLAPNQTAKHCVKFSFMGNDGRYGIPTSGSGGRKPHRPPWTYTAVSSSACIDRPAVQRTKVPRPA
jgi:hypothetical protein